MYIAFRDTTYFIEEYEWLQSQLTRSFILETSSFLNSEGTNVGQCRETLLGDLLHTSELSHALRFSTNILTPLSHSSHLPPGQSCATSLRSHVQPHPCTEYKYKTKPTNHPGSELCTFSRSRSLALPDQCFIGQHLLFLPCPHI